MSSILALHLPLAKMGLTPYNNGRSMQKKLPVTSSQSIKGGAPCIEGTRIPVSDLVFLVREKSIQPKKIVTEYYTQLSLDQVTNALHWFDTTRGKYA